MRTNKVWGIYRQHQLLRRVEQLREANTVLVNACKTLRTRLEIECECDPEDCPDCYKAVQDAGTAIAIAEVGPT